MDSLFDLDKALDELEQLEENAQGLFSFKMTIILFFLNHFIIFKDKRANNININAAVTTIQEDRKSSVDDLLQLDDHDVNSKLNKLKCDLSKLYSQQPIVSNFAKITIESNSNEIQEVAQIPNELQIDTQLQPDESISQLNSNEMNSNKNDQINEINDADTQPEVNEKASINLEAKINDQIAVNEIQNISEHEPVEIFEQKIENNLEDSTNDYKTEPIVQKIADTELIAVNASEDSEVVQKVDVTSEKKAQLIDNIVNDDIKSLSDDSDLFKDTIEDSSQDANQIEAVVDGLKERVASAIEEAQIETVIKDSLENTEEKMVVAVSTEDKKENLNDSFNDEPQIFYDSQEEFDTSHEASPVRDVKLKNETIAEEQIESQPIEHVKDVEEKVEDKLQVEVCNEDAQSHYINEVKQSDVIIEAQETEKSDEYDKNETEKSKEILVSVVENKKVEDLNQMNETEASNLIDNLVIDFDSIADNSNMMIDELLNNINTNENIDQTVNQVSNTAEEKIEIENIQNEFKEEEKSDEATADTNEANNNINNEESPENDSFQSGNEDDSFGRAEALPIETHSRSSSQSSYDNRQLSDMKEKLNNYSEEERLLGVVAPEWIPDSDMSECMMCSSKFTFTKRRHHCRGKFIVKFLNDRFLMK